MMMTAYNIGYSHEQALRPLCIAAADRVSLARLVAFAGTAADLVRMGEIYRAHGRYAAAEAVVAMLPPAPSHEAELARVRR